MILWGADLAVFCRICVYMRALGKDRPLSVDTGNSAPHMRRVDGPLLPWARCAVATLSLRYRLFSFSFFCHNAKIMASGGSPYPLFNNQISYAKSCQHVLLLIHHRMVLYLQRWHTLIGNLGIRHD